MFATGLRTGKGNDYQGLRRKFANSQDFFQIMLTILEGVGGKFHMGKGAIGVFDSGIGGLTVLKEIMELLPGEDTIYLGDTARVPYGNKSKETVERYSLEIASFLLDMGIKVLVVACNTASALALDLLKEKMPIPVIGVVEPGAKAAVEKTRSGVVGVIGTKATIKSRAYQRAIALLDGKVKVIARPCPLFVPLVEEGWVDNPVARMTAQLYLGDLKRTDMDVLVLGCTHYPLLKGVIQEVLGGGVRLVDSAEATARGLKSLLAERGLMERRGRRGRARFLLTDVSPHFVRTGGAFLKRRLEVEPWR